MLDRAIAEIEAALEADLWKRLGVGAPPKPYPSIALGVFEVTAAALLFF